METLILYSLAASALAYLLGSIPFGLLLTRAAGLGDIRKIGSGNIGATNVMRTGHKGLGAMTLLLDGLKGYAAVTLASALYGEEMALLAAFFAVIGHVFPIWLRYKGGKGVATVIGVFYALHWMLGLLVCFTWITIFLFFRISSLAALISIGFSSMVAFILLGEIPTILCVILTVLIFYTHRSNIKRLVAGKELGFNNKSA